MKQLIYIFLSTCLLYSCIKPDYEFENYESKIVIDGWIENGKFPKVLLTRSAAYFSEIDSASIRDYVLTTARVEVSDGENTEVLTLRPNNAYFPPYVYVATKLKGEAGKTYQLKVNYYDLEATATTTIPEPVTLDSSWFELKENSDSFGFIWLKFTDDIATKNYYRTLTKVQSKDDKYIANFFPNFNDKFFNGQDIEIALYKGNKSSTDKQDELNYMLGDTISLMFTVIDEQSYEFWNTFHKEITNAGNPFAATNARVKSNVKNGLGIWCGYGSNYYRIIAN
ncbi:MAG: DUF4249 domain-containing protein [Salinivirgaceae bacterium]|nr:DUF4249 domain-containing protein [Salinivirgaceae bacterium]